jgi:NADH-quinone oxidoreductase subunit L
MQGPTPVSALLHSSTMVCSGIYLFIRISTIYEIKYYNYILIIASITIVLASFSSFFLYDIKKIIALSTCSQIGYMFLSLGLTGISNSLFHLFTHGFFKALLFLLSGILIHSFSGSLKNTNLNYNSYFNEQDYRKFGGFLSKFRSTFIY